MRRVRVLELRGGNLSMHIKKGQVCEKQTTGGDSVKKGLHVLCKELYGITCFVNGSVVMGDV